MNETRIAKELVAVARDLTAARNVAILRRTLKDRLGDVIGVSHLLSVALGTGEVSEDAQDDLYPAVKELREIEIAHSKALFRLHRILKTHSM